MTFAQDERHQLCDTALAAGPGAATLCEGWTVADLVAHLHLRENDPIGALSLVVAPLQEVASRRQRELVTTYGFPGLVERVRRGPRRASLFALPGVDSSANGLEMYVHHEDIRRAADPVPPPRTLGAALENDLWGKLGMARMAFRKSPVGVVLERVDVAGQSKRVKVGTRTVTLVGLPSELVLYVFGRRSAADVELIGDPDSVAALEGSPVGV